jgi:hypothetical protein
MTVRTNLIFSIAFISAAFIMGCGPKTRTRVIDPSTGTESEAVFLTVNQDFDRSTTPYGDRENEFVLSGSIAAMTTGVEVYEVILTTSEPVPSGYCYFYNSSGTISENAASVAQISSTELVLSSRNGGYIFRLENDKDKVNFSAGMDLRGLAGTDLTITVSGITVATQENMSRRTLSVRSASKTIRIEEAPKLSGQALQTLYSYNGRGTDQEVASFELTNLSSASDSTVYHIDVVYNGSGLDLDLTDGNGNLIVTGKRKYSDNHLVFEVPVGTNPNMAIPHGGTNRFKLIADTTGASLSSPELQLQVTHIEARADSGVTGSLMFGLMENNAYVTFMTDF